MNIYPKINETNYLYTNQEYDNSTGLMYYNARYYSPNHSRFISRDTYMGEIGDPLSRNRYAYTINNPLKYTDPTGNNPAGLVIGYAALETALDICFMAYDAASLAYYSYQVNRTANMSSYTDKACRETYHQYYVDQRDSAAFDLALSYAGTKSPLVNTLHLKAGAKIVNTTADIASSTKKVDNVVGGSYSVYQGVDTIDNTVKYVGLTKRNPFTRFDEHLKSFGTGKDLLQYKPLTPSNLSRFDARILEQSLINQYGLRKNGGQLYNQINSISPNKWGQYGL